MNRVRSRDRGYTIVETMIFLGVSGVLFLSAMLLINGQQKRTEFSAQVREFDSKLQSVISNVASGYYNNPGAVTCEDQPGPTLKISPIPSTQGQNQDCTFIGQYLSLEPSTGPPYDKFKITSYAGVRLDSSGKEVTSLASAKPTPLTDTAEDYNLLSGMTVEMKVVGGSNITTLAIITTFSQYNSVNNTLDSGSSRLEVHADPGGANIVNPASGIQICLKDGVRTGIIFLNNGSTRVTIGNQTSTCP